MTFSSKDCEDFEASAVPHSWLLVADELHDSAELLFAARGRTITRCMDESDATPLITDHSNRPAFLLAGFSLENLIKAFLVYENPQWISDGRLSKQMTKGNHSLQGLADQSAMLPWPKKGRRVLEAFESGLSSWARYPCPLNASQVSSPRYFGDKLWEAYRVQRNRYAKELQVLLAKPWKGPHIHDASYEFT